MTLLEKVRAGKVPVEIRHVAAQERVDPDVLAQTVALGCAVVPANKYRKAERVIGIGQGLRTKVNANIGTSRDYPKADKELAKLDAAVEAGADTVMDLSTGGNIRAIRRAVVKRSPIAVGSVSIYDAAVAAVAGAGKNILAMTP
jgi:phosphomethylpyrimidine synthase